MWPVLKAVSPGRTSEIHLCLAGFLAWMRAEKSLLLFAVLGCLFSISISSLLDKPESFPCPAFLFSQKTVTLAQAPLKPFLLAGLLGHFASPLPVWVIRLWCPSGAPRPLS